MMILVVWTLMLWSFSDPASLRHLGIVMFRATGQFFECRSSAHFFLFRGQNDGGCLWLPMMDKRLKCSSRNQKTYIQCDPQPEMNQSHVLLPSGVSFNLWTGYFYGAGFSLPLFSKQSDSTDKKQASESQRERMLKKVTLCVIHYCNIQLKEWGIGSRRVYVFSANALQH